MPDEIRPDIPADAIFETDVPARLDRLPWSGFHWLVICALGIAWILDGLEVTIVGSLSGALSDSPVLHLSAEQVGAAASAYLIGAVFGALFFGWLTDRLGRKKLFSITVLIYLLATIACGLSWSFWSFALFRLLTGAGIGGEYAAVNATIQELIPARRRGFTDLVVNGSFWIGAAIGALGALVVLDPTVMPAEYGWRFAFIIGGVLGFIVLLLRRFLPESPRWLMTHGRSEEAEATTRAIEARTATVTEAPPLATIRLRGRARFGLWPLLRAILRQYPRRAVLGLVLMAAQAFFYNAIFFTYALVLGRFYGVPAGAVGRYIIAFAVGNFFGPLLLGRFFDSHGRKPMMIATYGLAGLMMIATAILFGRDLLDATQLTAAWTAIFFFASAAASAAYLTVGECFPLEARALIIAIFYAGGTAIGGLAGPALFGALLDQGSRAALMWGYLGAAALMLVAAAVEAWLGVSAERRSLESIAAPLSSIDPGSAPTR